LVVEAVAAVGTNVVPVPHAGCVYVEEATGADSVNAVLAQVVHAGFVVYGQLAEEPLHRSMVHALLSFGQAVLDDANTSLGQLELEPLHVSARSHAAAALRHT
jgi:hypothetical protein